MRKRGVLGLILVLVLSLISIHGVFAEHTATAEMQPVSIFESLTANYTLLVENSFWSPDSIYNVLISTQGVDILSLITPTDWTGSIDGNDIDYNTSTGAISSWDLQRFGFELRAQVVDENTTYTWDIETKDENNDASTTTVELTVINDDTPPVLTNPLPYNGMFVKEGTDDQETRIDAVDNETGVMQVNFNYDDCVYLNDTKSIVLSNNGTDTYSSVTDLSAYDDSTEVCFSFNAENNGGALSNYSGRLTIDGFPPTVTLISPPDNALMNLQSDFKFIAEDNLAPTLDCELLVDGNVEASITVNNNETSTLSVENVSEGQHEWAVRCTDLAGWTATSETRTYVLDRTPPSIRLNSPASLVIGEGTILNFVVTDNFELDGVAYNYSITSVVINKTTYASKNESLFEIDTTGWPEGPMEIHVSADDAAGNNATEEFVVIVDKTAPDVTLISPLNETDVNAEFVFNTTDEWDKMIDCVLYLNGTTNATTIVNVSESETGTISTVLAPAKYQWRIECEDDAGNVGVSDTWNVTILDTTGPTIVFNNMGVVVRGNDIVIDTTITDVSGVNPDTVYATMEGPDNVTVNVTLTREDDTDNYIGSYPTTVDSLLGDYIARVYAEDYIGNSNSEYDIYELTYAYVVDLNLDPNPSYTGDEVTASGTVAYDSGEPAGDEFITLVLPDTTMDVALTDGAFSYVFAAPSVAGDYDVEATITAENGFTFNDVETLEVQEKKNNNNNGGGGSGGGGGTSSHNNDDSSTFDCGVNKVRVDGRCVDATETEEPKTVSMPDQSQGDDHSSSGVVERGYCGDSYCDDNENPHNCALDCGEPTSGVGQATGFLNLSAISSSLLWILLLIAAILFVLVYLYQRGPPKIGNPFEKKDKLNLEDYLERRL